MEMINIALIDDHHIVRQGIRMLLEKENYIRVKLETDDAQELLNYLKIGESVDIIMMDINMPDVDGISLTKKILNEYPEIAIIILSMMDHIKYVSASFEAGAKGFMIKNVDREELLFGIHHVYHGEYFLCTEISMGLLRNMMQSPRNTHDLGEDPGVQFSKRETHVVNLIADGYTNQEIAEQLFTSKRTIEGYRQNLLEKTGMRNTAALIKYACQHNLLEE